MRLRSILSIAALLATLPAGAAELTPDRLTVGKMAELTLNVEPTRKIERISLMPGGPYVAWHLSGPGDEGGPFRWQAGEAIALVSMDRPGAVAVRFEREPAAAFESGGLRFMARAGEGLVIEREGREIGRARTSGEALDVAVAQGVAFVADGDNGLTLFDVSDPNRPWWLASHQKLGRVVAVAAEGMRAAALNDEGVIFLIDATNRAEPTVESAYRSAVPVRDLRLYADWVVARTDAGLDIIDFTALTPQISNEGLDFGQGVNFGGQRRVHIENGLAYVADWFSGIHIYDITRPRQPVLLSSFHTPGSPKGIIVREGVAFVPDDDHGLQIIDVSDPLTPRQLGHIQTSGLGYTPKLKGDLLFLASHRGGFHIIDVSDPAAPELVAEVDTEGKAWSLEVVGDRLYVADDDSGLLIFDVSDPARPRELGRFAPGGAAEEVVVRGDLAYVAFFEDGLYVVDVGDPAAPRVVSHTPLPGNTRGFDLVGDTLYVASWLAGIHVVDVSDPAAPRILGQFDTRGAAWGVKRSGDHLFVMDWWGGIAVVDVSDPARPVRAGGYHDLGRVEAIAGRGGYLFVAQGSQGVQVFDINNPLNPTWTTGVEFPGTARDIAIAGNQAFVAAGDGGVAVIDIANPFDIEWLGNFGREVALEIDAGERWLALRGERGEVVVMERGERLRPVQRIEGGTTAIALSGDTLFIADGARLQRFEYQDSRWKPTGTATLGNSITALAPWGEDVAAAAGDRLVILDGATLERTAEFALEAPARHLHADGARLFVTSATEVFTFEAGGGAVHPAARYRLLEEADRALPHRGTLYLGGAPTVVALAPLPSPRIEGIGDGQYRIALTQPLGVGSYNLSIVYSDGSHELVERALEVEMFTFSKPKLSLEEFRKIMEEKRGTDLFNQNP